MAARDSQPQAVNMESLYALISLLPPLDPNCCIYKVPTRLRNVNKNAYTPQLVSIGPLHVAEPACVAMQEHKWRFLRHFIQITGLEMQDCFEVVKGGEDSIRGCYADTILYPTDDFARLILLDAVFILEILFRFYSNEFDDESDRIYSRPWIIQHIVPDLLLLENQIPFFVVQAIYDEAKRDGSLPASLKEISLSELCYKFFKYNGGFVEGEIKASECPTFLHFVELGRKLYVPDEQLKQSDEAPRGRPRPEPRASRVIGRLNPTADGLKGSGSQESKFKIKFHDGILEIPKLFINDHTEIFLRNIIAFEQCHCTNFTVTNYCVLLKRLVGTPQDLELLVEHEIVDYTLGDINQVFTLITKLADEVTVDYTDSEFVKLCEDMDKYCKVSWHKWKANLKQIYFDTPWTTLSVIAASVVIILTFIQTVCSILSLK